jgi:hypothetical protein
MEMGTTMAFNRIQDASAEIYIYKRDRLLLYHSPNYPYLCDVRSSTLSFGPAALSKHLWAQHIDETLHGDANVADRFFRN